MFSLVKIFGQELDVDQSKSFSYTVKDYKQVKGLLLCGQAEVSLVFDKDNTVFANSLELDSNKDVEPNKRALIFNHEITSDFIKGSVIKRKTQDTVSVYLIIE